jgi:hypothetical protein
MFVFIIAFACHFLLGWPSLALRIVTRLLLLPVIAGLSYELLKWAGRSDNIVVKILSLPGLYLQKITTKEPDESMLQVAISAVTACMDDQPSGSYMVSKDATFPNPELAPWTPPAEEDAAEDAKAGEDPAAGSDEAAGADEDPAAETDTKTETNIDPDANADTDTDVDADAEIPGVTEENDTGKGPDEDRDED